MRDAVLWYGWAIKVPHSHWPFNCAALVLRPDTWSLLFSVKRGSHVLGPDGELGWTLGFLCFYLMWGRP